MNEDKLLQKDMGMSRPISINIDRDGGTGNAQLVKSPRDNNQGSTGQSLVIASRGWTPGQEFRRAAQPDLDPDKNKIVLANGNESAQDLQQKAAENPVIPDTSEAKQQRIRDELATKLGQLSQGVLEASDSQKLNAALLGEIDANGEPIDPKKSEQMNRIKDLIQNVYGVTWQTVEEGIKQSSFGDFMYTLITGQWHGSEGGVGWLGGGSFGFDADKGEKEWEAKDFLDELGKDVKEVAQKLEIAYTDRSYGLKQNDIELGSEAENWLTQAKAGDGEALRKFLDALTTRMFAFNRADQEKTWSVVRVALPKAFNQDKKLLGQQVYQQFLDRRNKGPQAWEDIVKKTEN